MASRDLFIEFIKGELYHGFALALPSVYGGIFKKIERLVEEHRAAMARGDPETSTELKRLVPTISAFFTSLPLEEAWRRYDAKYAVSQRKCVPPSFNEVRHILNLAQVMALAGSLQMISFDGDQTLYSDGGNFGNNIELASLIGNCLTRGVYVVLITAAGYGLDGPRYEQRVQGLLDYMKAELKPEAMRNFFVLGGECNFLLRCSREGRLLAVPEEEWQPEELGRLRPGSWPLKQTQKLLDVAERTMRESIKELRLRATLIRKSRAVGIIPGGDESILSTPVGHGSKKLKKEALDEVALRCQRNIEEHLRREAAASGAPPGSDRVPFCAFNGGRDAWVDVGNKDIGAQAMQAFLKVSSETSLHVGDQFLDTGNDVAARRSSPSLWILNPKETLKVLQILLGLMCLGDECHEQSPEDAVNTTYGSKGVRRLEHAPPSPPLTGLSPTISPKSPEGVSRHLPDLALSSDEVEIMRRASSEEDGGSDRDTVSGRAVIKSPSALQLQLCLEESVGT